MDTLICFTWITLFFNETFKYGDTAKFWDYVGTNAESFCVELWNLAQWHNFVNYLTYH
jgi:hypothetical protein